MTIKLYWSTRSPFARKVAICLHELGVAGNVEFIPVAVGYDLEPPGNLAALNPLAQVPTLELDDGSAIFDSSVICGWLDEHFGNQTLYPRASAAWLQCRRREALGDGLMTKSVRRLVESRRSGGQAATVVLGATIHRVLDALEQDGNFDGQAHLDVGFIAIGVALSYLDFRCAELVWRNRRPRLAAWFEPFAMRPAALATRFR